MVNSSPPSAPSDPAASRPSRLRWVWWLLAYLCLGIGIIGIVVPGLPTTVFVLIAAYAASRSSQRLHHYLLQHTLFGPMIGNWQQHGAVSRSAKWAASLSVAICAALILLTMHWAGAHRDWMAVLAIACMCVVLAWLWLRPEPPDCR